MIRKIPDLEVAYALDAVFDTPVEAEEEEEVDNDDRLNAEAAEVVVMEVDADLTLKIGYSSFLDELVAFVEALIDDDIVADHPFQALEVNLASFDEIGEVNLTSKNWIAQHFRRRLKVVPLVLDHFGRLDRVCKRMDRSSAMVGKAMLPPVCRRPTKPIALAIQQTY